MPEYRYEATVKTILDRLEIMGYTSVRWRAELELFRREQMEELQEQIALDQHANSDPLGWMGMVCPQRAFFRLGKSHDER